MEKKVHWTLPVPSTALLGSGPKFEQLSHRDVRLRFAVELDTGGRRDVDLVLYGTEAFKCTYYQARDLSTLDAYDRLIECGGSEWLQQVRGNLSRRGGAADGLVHYMIDFDDGPAYEFICRGFRVAGLDPLDEAGV